ATPCLRLAQADARQFGVGEQAEGHETARRHTVDAGEVVADHADIVVGDMCEMGAAGAIAHCPHAGGRGPQPAIDLDEAPVVPFDPGGLQADAVGVRGPAGRNQEVRSLDHAVRRMQPYGLAGSPLHARDGRGRQHLDPLVAEEFPQRFRDVAIFAVSQGVGPLNDRNATAEASQGLGHLESDIAAPRTRRCFGTRSNSRASMCVIGRDSARPGIGSIRAREPVQITTTSPRRVRVPSSTVTSIVLGPTKRPCPLTSSAPLSRYALTLRATMPSTIFRLRARTAGISTFQSPAAMPNSAPLRK